MSEARCPVCDGRFGGAFKNRGHISNKDAIAFDCEACGVFSVSNSAMATQYGSAHQLTSTGSAALSHWLRRKQNGDGHPSLLHRDFVDADTWSLPSPVEITSHVLSLFGDIYTESREPIKQVLPWMLSDIGFFDSNEACSLLIELVEAGLLKGTVHRATSSGQSLPSDLSLTLLGWEEYRKLKTSGHSGSYGFIAMQYGASELEALVAHHIKPTAQDELGLEVRDLRDVAKAGIIDNILREQIRESAFVLVDLTHDNNGAYWEAGYAEGLGKPVIYLCNQDKFDDVKTHFDTNHLTTVMWKSGEEAKFVANLFPTIRRSLLN